MRCAGIVAERARRDEVMRAQSARACRARFASRARTTPRGADGDATRAQEVAEVRKISKHTGSKCAI
jgi:hypothetical protein